MDQVVNPIPFCQKGQQLKLLRLSHIKKEVGKKLKDSTEGSQLQHIPYL